MYHRSIHVDSFWGTRFVIRIHDCHGRYTVAQSYGIFTAARFESFSKSDSRHPSVFWGRACHLLDIARRQPNGISEILLCVFIVHPKFIPVVWSTKVTQIRTRIVDSPHTYIDIVVILSLTHTTFSNKR
jgi:hypothetical protein